MVLWNQVKNVIVGSRSTVIIHAVILIPAPYLKGPPVPRVNAVILPPASPNHLVVYAEGVITSVICQSTAMGHQNFVLMMFTKWMELHAKWGRLIVTRGLVGPTRTSANYFGVHLVKNRTISVMSRTERGQDMGIVDLIDLMIPIFPAEGMMCAVACYTALT